ncbi:MAG: hypothetical protein FWG21_06220, partial [Oscillospiraceae bacterium]|nr:hypothetical protein [Oscillospiraceae bacterium]
SKAYLGAIEAYTALRIEFRVIECYQLLVDNCPDFVEGYMMAAHFFLDKGDTNSALEYCMRQIEVVPDHPEGYVLATNIYYEAQAYESALNYANQLIELFDVNYDGYCYAIQSLNLLDNNEQAIALAKDMIKTYPDDAMSYVYLGFILYEEGDYAKASQAVNSCKDQEDFRIVSLKRLIRGKTIVNISDATFEVALRTYLKRNTGDILLEDMFDITYLEIVGGRNPKVVFDGTASPLDTVVEQLDDLVYFESLIGLKIRHLDFEDFTQISQIPDLCMLSLDTTNVSDISFVRQLAFLISLTITNGVLEDISPLVIMKYLEDLTLDDNQISSLINFSELSSLSQLSLSDNLLSDISDLTTATKLTVLNLSGNEEITSVQCLSTLPYLNSLNLLGCNPEDIKSVLHIPDLIYG